MKKAIFHYQTLICVTIIFLGCPSKKNRNNQEGKIIADTLNTFEKSIDTIGLLKGTGIEKAYATVVPENGSLLIKTSKLYPKLVMGNNSRLIFSPSFKGQLIIWEGSFGENCQIIADGTKGKNAGLNPDDPWKQPPYWWQADRTVDGLKGFPGLNGENGTKGLEVQIQIGFSAVGSLSIHADGGDGGNGGKAGNGQLGGNKTFLSSCGNGGPGGDGGNGGNGGDGGELLVQIWRNSDLSGPTDQVVISANGGRGGNGGENGDGVRGGSDCPSGAQGVIGKKGQVGKQGQARFERVNERPSLIKLINSIRKEALSDRKI